VTFEVAPPNDLGVHPKGHILIATADSLEASPTGGVFALLRAEMQRLAGGYTVGNGPAFSPDGRTVYAADSPKGVIYAYDWDEERLSMTNRRIFAAVPGSDGLPDGLTVDAEGGIWNARWGGARVVRYDPDGTESFTIELPARLVTSCAFGGESFRTLYITTARLNNGGGDLGGLLFRTHVGVAGTQPAVGMI
jgi:sugar lactone lactonase YvrE